MSATFKCPECKQDRITLFLPYTADEPKWVVRCVACKRMYVLRWDGTVEEVIR